MIIGCSQSLEEKFEKRLNWSVFWIKKFVLNPSGWNKSVFKKGPCFCASVVVPTIRGKRRFFFCVRPRRFGTIFLFLYKEERVFNLFARQLNKKRCFGQNAINGSKRSIKVPRFTSRAVGTSRFSKAFGFALRSTGSTGSTEVKGGRENQTLGLLV